MFRVKKHQAQRSLKYFHSKHILFTAEDLINQGIDFIQNTNPQQYFPSYIKADIIQDLKKRHSVLVEPTGVNLSKGSLISNNLEDQKARSFFDILIHLPFAPLYMHKLQLKLSIDKQYYKEERIEMLKEYQDEIEKEKQGVSERIKALEAS